MLSTHSMCVHFLCFLLSKCTYLMFSTHSKCTCLMFSVHSVCTCLMFSAHSMCTCLMFSAYYVCVFFYFCDTPCTWELHCYCDWHATEWVLKTNAEAGRKISFNFTSADIVMCDRMCSDVWQYVLSSDALICDSMSCPQRQWCVRLWHVLRAIDVWQYIISIYIMMCDNNSCPQRQWCVTVFLSVKQWYDTMACPQSHWCMTIFLAFRCSDMCRHNWWTETPECGSRWQGLQVSKYLWLHCAYFLLLCTWVGFWLPVSIDIWSGSISQIACVWYWCSCYCFIEMKPGEWGGKA